MQGHHGYGDEMGRGQLDVGSRKRWHETVSCGIQRRREGVICFFAAHRTSSAARMILKGYHYPGGSGRLSKIDMMETQEESRGSSLGIMRPSN